MKRYSQTIKYYDTNVPVDLATEGKVPFPEMVEDPDGQWVQFNPWYNCLTEKIVPDTTIQMLPHNPNWWRSRTVLIHPGKW